MSKSTSPKNEKPSSKFLSLLLRHSPEIANLDIEENGWIRIDQLLANTSFKLDQLKQIVKDDSKQRYSFDSEINPTKIRANQGHSVAVKVLFKSMKPPEMLYHGTAKQNVKGIFQSGINKGSRHYVHLSSNLETATAVGKRHGDVIILHIKAGEMFNDGFEFLLSENNVWMTDNIPAKYISFQ